ncbi:GNAT family N-acetyltransferase [Oceanobacillus sp. 1P07AA]|uniref:GNAT family N-acetyltransferase n=1 Tax=Oceanobacillus sp. 1P07AA TaxID=3132293 RepID=UPI0039A53AD1
MNNLKESPYVSGLQSHGRSIIVWPSLINNCEIDYLRRIVGFGCRIICIGGKIKSLPIWPGEINVHDLCVMKYRKSTMNNCKLNTHYYTKEMIKRVQSLQRSCCITPLPKEVYFNDDIWKHSIVIDQEVVKASGSIQLLKNKVNSSKITLVCGIAVDNICKQKGFGGRIVKDLVRQSKTSELLAFVENDNKVAKGFFNKLGWEQSSEVVQYSYWK